MVDKHGQGVYQEKFNLAAANQDIRDAFTGKPALHAAAVDALELTRTTSGHASRSPTKGETGADAAAASRRPVPFSGDPSADTKRGDPAAELADSEKVLCTVAGLASGLCSQGVPPPPPPPPMVRGALATGERGDEVPVNRVGPL
ncbi:hypothetical protein T484DRAFT_1875057 [Baffinella frigidus]|nr:hypothetical protein T484DRAFT_1875057 [Cryptophyta sp. CCMP2293]